MNYQEQLKQKEWLDKREKILERDNNTCQHCKKKLSQTINFDYTYGVKSLAEVPPEPLSGLNIGNYIYGLLSKEPRKNPYNEDIDYSKHKKEDIKCARFWNDQTKKYEFIYFVNEDYILKFMSTLNVHHKYYVKGKLAWEYKEDALISLCPICHKKEHENTIIKVYENEKLADYIEAGICTRCNGSGYLPQYSHVENGICFNCWGHGINLIFPEIYYS